MCLEDANPSRSSHGKDHKLCVWGFHADDESSLNKVLPLDVGRVNNTGKLPSLVHSLPVNALNFCAFSLLFLGNWRESRPVHHNWGSTNRQSSQSHTDDTTEQTGGAEKQGEPKLRVESKKAHQSENNQTAGGEGAAKFQSVQAIIESGIPSLIAVPNTLNSGAIDIYHLPSKRRVSTISAETSTETGMLMAVNIFITKSEELYAAASYEDGHVMLFACRDDFRDRDAIQSGGANASWKWDKIYSHKSHRQPSLSLDVSPSKTYFLTSAADSILVKHPIPTPSPASSSLPSAAATYSPFNIQKASPAGQESLRIRSDGLVFATACWDDTVKVYRCQTVKPMTSINWHKEGCHAVAFGEVDSDDGASTGSLLDNPSVLGAFTLAAVQRQRVVNVQYTHWLVAGSKTGRISLWDMY